MANIATKKLGPLPTWAWVAGGLLFVGMVVYFRRNSGDVAPAEVDNSQIGAPAETPPQYIGSSDGSVYGGGATYDPADFAEGDPVGFPTGMSGSDFLSGLLAGIQSGSGFSPTPAPTIFEPPTQPYQTQTAAPTTGQGTQTVQTTTATEPKQTSFMWDGKRYGRGDFGTFKAYLKLHGLSYKDWASKHPKAAMDVFGTMG